MTGPAINPRFLDSPATLQEAAQEWSAAPVVGLDTEFVRERTFFPRFGLVQIATDHRVDLVDPLACSDLTPLADLVRAPGVLKLIHSASGDLELFGRELGCLPEPLFDTQIGAALAGLGPALSYQRLVSELCGVELFKGETRTDWLARPLSQGQLEYAAEDVAYLLETWERLRERLESLGRLSWAQEDSAALVARAAAEDDPERAYLRLRSAHRMTPLQLGVARALAAWRESEARRRDLPRGFVLRDEVLVGLALRRPRTVQELHRLRHLDPRQAARDGATWLELVRQAAALPEDELPPLSARPLAAPGARELDQRLRALLQRRATELALPVELLASRRQIESLVASLLVGDRELPSDWLGWRRAVIGEPLLAALAGGSGAKLSDPPPVAAGPT